MIPRNDFGDVVKIMILGRFGHPQLVYLLSELEKYEKWLKIMPLAVVGAACR